MKRALLILVLIIGGVSVNAQTKVAHINSQKLLDTLQSRKDAMAKLKQFEEEGVGRTAAAAEVEEPEANF